MAKGPPVCACGLPFVSDIPPIRNLWPVVSIPARCRFHRREHCGMDLEYRDVSGSIQSLEEVSKLLEAILNSDS